MISIFIGPRTRFMWKRQLFIEHNNIYISIVSATALFQIQSEIR